MLVKIYGSYLSVVLVESGRVFLTGQIGWPTTRSTKKTIIHFISCSPTDSVSSNHIFLIFLIRLI